MRKFYILLLFYLCIAYSVKAQQAYAVLSNDGLTVTFYYDTMMNERSGVVEITNFYYYGMNIAYGTATTAIFDASFANYRPTSTAFWFYGCKHLISIIGLENLHTANVTDMRYMFQDCSSIANLDISSFNTSNVTDMEGMFRNCSSLENINLNSFDTKNVTNMAMMFSGCSALTALDLSSFRTPKLRHMGDMFYRCSSLTSLDLHLFDTSNVKYYSDEYYTFYQRGLSDMSYVFCECRSLVNLDISSFNTENVTDLSGMFAFCTSLKSIDVSSFNTSNVYNMGDMFIGCSSLNILDLSSFNTGKVKNISRMFYTCSELKTIYVSNLWQLTTEAAQCEEVFVICPKLVGGQGTEWNQLNVNGSYAHIDGGTINPGYFTSKTESAREPYATLSNGNRTLTFYYDNQKTNRNGMDIKEVNLTYSGDSDAPWAGYSSTITSVVFDNSFADCNLIRSTRWWFLNFTNLTNIVGIENLKTENVTDMSGMFEGCSAITYLDLSPLNTNYVNDMAFMFDGCHSLKQINISNFNTSNVTNMTAMFQSCWALTKLDISNFNTSQVVNMGGMFNACNSLEDLIIGQIETGRVITMQGMFGYCYKLKSLNLSSFNTLNVSNMNSMFKYCKTLEKIYVSNTWTTENITEGEQMFQNCEKIVGGKHTTYNEAKTDYTYAHIDYGPSNPGYLTDILDIDDNGPISTIDTEITIICNSLSGRALSDNVVDDVYYNVGPDGYDSSDGSVVISQTTNMSQITDATSGSDDIVNNFTGLILKVAAGKGTIKVNSKTTGNAQLVVQVGKQSPTIATKTEQGDVVVSYDVAEDTYVYIYAIIGSDAAPARRAALADAVKIYSITVTPGATAIDSIPLSGEVDDRIYTLDGRPANEHTIGIVVKGEKKYVK